MFPRTPSSRARHVSNIAAVLGGLFWLVACGNDPKAAAQAPAAAVEAQCKDGLDNDGDGKADCNDVDCQSPGGDCVAAPPLDRTVATTVADSPAYLYTGDNPLQKGADPKAFDPNRIAVIHGSVKDTAGAPLPGAKVSIRGHTEYGTATTLADGSYSMAVNGGSRLLLEFTLDGYLSAQRVNRPAWQSHVNLDDVRLVAADGKTTTVALTPEQAQVLTGSLVTDANGTREPLVLFEPGTVANAVLPDGTKQALSKMTVTVTELPIDSKNRALPGAAPTTAGPIYGLDFEVAEAKALNASHVEFSRPVSLYVENLFGLTVGTTIPFSIYDRATGQWETTSNGRVIQILGSSDGAATLDGDGDGTADSASALSTLGITASDLTELGARYPANTKLWYGKLAHFSDAIGQARAVAPKGAIAPSSAGLPAGVLDHPSRLGAALVEPQSISHGIPITGTPYSLEYQSIRAKGYGPAYRLQLPLTGAQLPPGLKRVEYRVSVAGKQYQGSVTAAPNLIQPVPWDGMDLNGRLMQSPQRAEVYIGYVYDGTPSGEVTLGGTFVTKMGLWDARSFDLGGFGLNVMHAYDPPNHTIYFGYGEQRSGENIALVTKPTNLDPSFSVGTPDSVFVASDGSLIVTDDQQQDATAPGRILRITPSGQSSVLVGSGASGAASKLLLGQPQGIAALDDGTLIVADVMQGAIRSINKSGVMTTLVSGAATDNPITLHPLTHADGLALGPRQELYMVDIDRVLVLEAGKLGTFAGGGIETVEGGYAINASLAKPSGVAVAQDGTLYITERDGHRIRKVLVDGRIVTVAGNGTADFKGDGGQAVNAQVSSPRGIALGPDGTLYFADQGNNRIRRITTDGIISTVVGGGKYVLGSGVLAINVALDEPDGLAVGPDNALYITSLDAIYRVVPGLPQLGDGDNLIPSEDGMRLYQFDAKGKHLSTIDPVTGVTELTFGYDASGLPATITDEDGLITTIKRDASGTPTSIVGPYGQVTQIALSNSGNLAEVTDPIGRAVTLEWDGTTGLLNQVTDPKSRVTTYSYDVTGRLTDVRDPIDSLNPSGKPTVHFEPGATKDGFASVKATSKGGEVSEYFSRNQPAGTWQRQVTLADGSKSEWTDDPSQPVSVTLDGTKTQQFLVPDDQFATQSMIPGATITDLPSGRQLVTVMSRTKTMSDPTSVLSLDTWTDRVEINQRVYESKYSRSTRTMATKSPMGRTSTSTTTVDALGRPVNVAAPGMPTVSWTYDNDGRGASITKTAGTETRTEVRGYGSDGWLASRTNPLSEQVAYAWDLVGRPTTVTRPDGQSSAWTFDEADDVTSLIPPGRGAHSFSYDPVTKLLSTSTPPAVTQTGTTLLAGQQLYSYGDDHELLGITHSDGRSVAFAYDNAHKLTTERLSKATLSFSYDYGGTLTSVNRSDSVRVDMTHDGPLWTGTTWSGPVKGTVTADYDTNLWLKSLTVNNASTVNFTYDNDGLLIGASSSSGGMTVTRDAQTGLVTATALGVISTANQYTGFAELKDIAVAGNTAFFAQDMVRDSLGRVTHLTEYNQGSAHDIYYSYDHLGRLISAKRDGVTTAYSYDLNGNRTSVQSGTDPLITATYDAQDRILSYGAISYQHSPHGDLQNMTDGRASLSFDYDELGNLLTATVTSQGATNVIKYVVDGFGRRVGRQVNGNFDRAWLYRDGLRPVSEVDAAGTFTHFVYADSAVGAPDFLIRSGVLYRVVKDHIGSVRLVVNAQSGAVVQSLEYDEYGAVLADSNPGFQPFGFAGGLYDADTTLVRFGARDYDALSGRWTNKDPIGFAGGDTNIYAYVGGDPVNYVDPDGRHPVALVAATVAGILLATSDGEAAAAAIGGIAGALVGPLLGLLGRSAAPAGTELVHLTGSGNQIVKEGVIRGGSGIYATTRAVAGKTGIALAARTGLSSASATSAILVPDAAAQAFSRPLPIGILSGWQRIAGTQCTAAGFIDLEAGAFIRTGVNWNQVLLYGLDVGADGALGGIAYAASSE